MPLPALSLEPVPLAVPPAADGTASAASPSTKAEPLLQPPARLRGIGPDGELEYG